MNRLEYFREVLKAVAELMELEESDILGESRELDVVDARWMVIYLMKERGYQTKHIASLIGRPERTVNHAFCNFEDRVRYSLNGLGNTLAMVRQELGNK